MLVCFHDYTSPASAVAVLRLHRLADAGARIGFEGFEVLGLDVALPPTLDLLSELERHTEAAAALGLDLQRPRRQPPTFRAHLVGDVAEGQGLGMAWREVCYRAYLERGLDIGDATVLADLADEAGLDVDGVIEALEDREHQQDLRRRIAGRRGEGVGGVPVLNVDGMLVSALMPEADLAQLAALHGS